VARFTRNVYYPDPTSTEWGKVYVATSNGWQFNPIGRSWIKHFCASYSGVTDVCGTGDFNGDGWDDVVAFNKNSGTVWVALNNRDSTFAGSSVWRNVFCGGEEVCGVGDFNNDRKDDIITYLRSTYANKSDPAERKIGYVYVALSNGSAFPHSDLWSDLFCIGNQTCGSGDRIDNVGPTTYSQVSRTGDFNGDGSDDVVTFLRNTEPDTKDGWVDVKLAYGNGFVDSIPQSPAAWVLSLFFRYTP
jgi:hypothetical protein